VSTPLGTLQIADLEFVVTTAKLDAFVSRSSGPPRMSWGFTVETAREAEPYSDWEPQLSSEILFYTRPGELTSWRDVAPLTIEWDDPATPDNDPWASLYVFEHAPMPRGRAELVRVDDEIRLRLTGSCAVWWDDTYGKDLELRLDTAVDFVGVLSGRDSEAEAREGAEPFLDGSLLRYHRDEYGVATLRPRR
jgi:hypothetical protein